MKKIQISLPEDVNSILKSVAVNDCRSLNKEITCILIHYANGNLVNTKEHPHWISSHEDLLTIIKMWKEKNNEKTDC